MNQLDDRMGEIKFESEKNFHKMFQQMNEFKEKQIDSDYFKKISLNLN